MILIDFGDEEHMNHTGEFKFAVNETCLSCDHEAFIVALSDKDAHNPILIHFTPSDVSWNEQRTYVPYERKVECKQHRKEQQRTNKRKGYPAGQEEEEDDGPWLNFGTQEWLDYQSQHRRQQCGSGYGGSSAFSSHQWKPKCS